MDVRRPTRRGGATWPNTAEHGEREGTWRNLKKPESPQRAIFSNTLEIVGDLLFSGPEKKLLNT